MELTILAKALRQLVYAADTVSVGPTRCLGATLTRRRGQGSKKAAVSNTMKFRHGQANSLADPELYAIPHGRML